MDAVRLMESGINCDTPGCGYTVTVPNDNIPEMLNAKCPRCGAILITADDVAMYEFVKTAMTVVNAAVPAMTPEQESVARQVGEVTFRIGSKDGNLQVGDIDLLSQPFKGN